MTFKRSFYCWIAVIISAPLVASCTLMNTDGQLPHQIISAPEKRSIGWEDEIPLDVTEERKITRVVCSQARPEA
jgi:hypothetical protein